VVAGLEVMISSNGALEAITESHGLAESVEDSAILQVLIEVLQINA